ncbi:MAG: ribonuclease P protein component [Chloroflexaceae bacterium]|nr:ribonuclease P protein component [Chloroflexaceae bacterium]NJO04696.1 ribonuclease P protein component [Chloroflexaceae bacterium]
MKRANRLRRPQQFQRVRRDGRVVSHRLLRLNVAANHRRQSRCGIIVSKQIGKSVQRNRTRRRVREAVRLFLPSIAPGVDMVFIVRSPDVADVPFAVLQDTIQCLLKEANVWRGEAVAAVQASIVAGPE